MLPQDPLLGDDELPGLATEAVTGVQRDLESAELILEAIRLQNQETYLRGMGN